MKNTSLKLILFIIFVAALFLRLFVVFNQPEPRRVPLSDAKQYDNIAVNVISGRGFSENINGPSVPTTIRTPAYPLFLAGIYTVFGHNYLAVKIIQAICGALFCIIIYLIAQAIYNDKLISILSSLITALYQPFISGFSYYGGPAWLLSEYFYMFVVGLVALLTIFYIKKENVARGALLGILIGIGILTRPEFLIYPVILGIYLFYKSGFSAAKIIKKYLILFVFISAVITPWIIRNYIAQHRFIPLSTLGGYVFWQGNNSFANGSWGYPKDYKETMNDTRKLSEYDRNNIFFKKGLQELKDNPKRIPKLFTRKILVHWAPFEEGLKIFNINYAIFLFIGFTGIIFFRKKNMEENILLIFFLLTTFTAVITYGDPRYRYPYEPYLFIFAALAIKNIMTKFIIDII